MGLERLIELAKLFQLHTLRKRFDTTEIFAASSHTLHRLETIHQSRAKNSTETSIGQIKHRYAFTREAL